MIAALTLLLIIVTAILTLPLVAECCGLVPAIWQPLTYYI